MEHINKYYSYFLDEQDIYFLVIIYLVGKYVCIPFNVTCSYVLVLTTSFMYFTNHYFYHFFIIHFLLWDALFLHLPKSFSS